MKASELRIGNWVCDIYQEEEFQLDIVDMCDMDINGDLYRTDPIPITEEWLLKFDFEKKIDFYSPDELWGKEEFENPRRAFGVFNPDNKDEWFVMFREDVGCGWSDLNEIKYVHQLQNLYFALTQEEL